MDERRRRFLRLMGLGAFSLAGGGALAVARLLDRSDPPAPEGPRSATPSTAASPTSTTPDDPPPTSTTTEPDEPSAGFGDTATVALLCRNAWGAQAPTRAVPRHTVRRIMVHHTAVVLDDNRDAPTRVRSHQAFHQREGLADLAYHVIIDANGNAYEGRDPSTPGETFTEYDTEGWYLVTCEGNFDQQPLPAEQQAALEKVLAWASVRFGVDPASIRGHRDEAPTACPGDSIARLLADGSLVAGVRDRIAAGAAVVHMCGDDAETRMEAIEAGTA